MSTSCTRVCRVRGEIRFLEAEMASMEAVLNMLSKKPAHQISELDEIWARDLKELTYDIEDSVDTFMVHIYAPVQLKPHSFRSFFDRTMGFLTKARVRHHVAKDIEDIKRRIHEVAERRRRYQLEGVAAGPDTTTVDLRVLACFEQVEKLVGTDVPVEKISNLLTKGKGAHQHKPMVVSIVGVGGLGKTTIANLVYERLAGKFDCKAFVSVSLRPNMKQILNSILRQISDDKCTNAGEKDPEELIRTVRQFLKDKRYFIVIDDVWSEEAWKTIQGALIDNNLQSKVIITTRNVGVAEFSSVDGDMYELDSLSYKDSIRLFSKRIFNSEDGFPSELEEVTMKLLKKCGGIPLAIITIASMLACIPNKSKYEWYRVYKSMGSGLEKDKSLRNMRDILYLSYNDLPSYLKPCLLHLNMFPEDSTIRKDNLIRLWIAEGFLNRDWGVNLHDLGEKYFNELVNRSMIQSLGIDEAGIALACRVHDMILDLIISISDQENFVTISGDPNHICSTSKIRHLSLQGSMVVRKKEASKDKKVMRPTTVDMSHVRTLIALGDAFEWMQPLSRFSVLRALVLECFPINNNNHHHHHLKDLGSLHHLRYLEIRGKFEADLLQAIGNLKHLNTLYFSGTSIKELPASIVQLRELESLMTGQGVKFPDGIGNLVSLQQLEVDATGSPQTLAELGNLTRLRLLRVIELSDDSKKSVKNFLQSLSNLHNIHTLYILNGKEKICSLDCMPDQWSSPAHLQYFYTSNLIMTKLPRWFSSLFKLSCLSIEVNKLRQDDVELLGALSVLRFLDLAVGFDGTTEERLVIGIDHPFGSLTDFKFKHFARCWLVFGHGVMPKLRRLKLHFRVQKREGGAFDVGLENLTSLKQVQVEVNCIGATVAKVQDAEAKFRDAIDKHQNHPTLELSRKD
ncbi:hypothetical protein EJB05_13971 [Eragrostis curvula]|uniref:AAA+ ATPase domain-containing protein n=1 Tax=Eragrostis curvula TaxID=38414 RepID=A0A5J9VYS8_9POAL|nr:hypothetical protein EJB05_13971 [Eragrostis curvula]